MSKIEIFQDGTAWCALKGEDIQSGKCAFGSSADGALSRFWQLHPEETTITHRYEGFRDGRFVLAAEEK